MGFNGTTKAQRQEMFCMEYLKDLNGSAAYKRVYPKSSDAAARVGASKLLSNPNIMRRISELKNGRADRTKLNGDMVIKRLADIAFAHIGLVATWDEEGRLTLKETKDLTERELAAIDDIQCSPVSDGDGGLLGYKKRVKMKDSLKALELLSRHLGLLDGNGGNTGDSDAAAKRLLEAIGRVKQRSTSCGDGNKGSL
jgi:phage terminase small subunit